MIDFMRQEFKDLLFLVALPRGKLLKTSRQLQGKLNEKYNLYRDKLPPLHVTIERLKIEDEAEYLKAVGIIDSICELTEPFEVKVDGFSFFDSPYKSINLKVSSTQSLKELSEQLNIELKKEGFTDRIFDENWEFHISLISMVFADREWSSEEFEEAKRMTKGWKLNLSFKVEWLELWRPQYNPRLVIEDFFPLRKKDNIVRRQELRRQE